MILRYFKFFLILDYISLISNYAIQLKFVLLGQNVNGHKSYSNLFAYTIFNCSFYTIFSTVANMGDISDFDDVRTCDIPTPSGSSSPKTSFQNAENDDDDDIETPAGKYQFMINFDFKDVVLKQ